MTSDLGKTSPEPVGKQPTLLEELKKGVGWVLYQVVGRYIYLILGLMMLAKEKYPGTGWAEALSLLAKIIMGAIVGSMMLIGLALLLSIGFWFLNSLFNLGLWALHRATGEHEVQEIVY